MKHIRHMVCFSTNKSDCDATHVIAMGGDALVHAPAKGWPEDVALSLTDAPEAALMCEYSDHAAMHIAMGSSDVVTWDDFRIEPWVGSMVLPAGKRLRCHSEHPSVGMRAECHVVQAAQ